MLSAGIQGIPPNILRPIALTGALGPAIPQTTTALHTE